MRNLKHTLESIILCIRFPFLYPRNRWTNTHYCNYKIIQLSRKLYTESCKLIVQENITTPNDLIITCKWKFYLSKFLKWYHNYPLQLFHCIPTYNELDAMDKGWRKSFGIQLCKDLKSVLKKAGYLYSYRVLQIKEKWGELYWYDNDWLITKDVLQKYAQLSYKTCIVCGKPSTYRTPVEAWECPYCDEHVPDYIAKDFLIKL